MAAICGGVELRPRSFFFEIRKTHVTLITASGKYYLIGYFSIRYGIPDTTNTELCKVHLDLRARQLKRPSSLR
jgi:hypothetical protein